MFDWNDLKPFLAVARGGSTLAASRALGVNQTTVARRVEALEAALDLKLFDRGQTGSRLTEAGRDLLVQAEQVERTAETFASRAAAHRRGLAGAVRLTATEIIANTTLMPALAEFRRLYPDVQVDLLISDKTLDLHAGEADVAIRSGAVLTDSDLIARKLHDYDFALYCSRDYAARRGAPATLEELARHDLIGGDAELAGWAGMVWLFEKAGGATPAARSNTMGNLYHAVKAGLGIAPLATLLGDGDRSLVRCSDVIPEASGSSWLVTRKELRDTPRMRAFIDFLVPHFQGQMRQMEAAARAIREEATVEA
ncbi:LysR family transcriptional regulator [Phenylobacterium sp.]|jgi:DNA-binding transcriptional LysR family regulator|uniref:LysR family transcriptional regulator n=1 Tax=Phenylobacterium sp. TaxID=1871053 RepID=UPI002F92DF97